MYKLVHIEEDICVKMCSIHGNIMVHLWCSSLSVYANTLEAYANSFACTLVMYD